MSFLVLYDKPQNQQQVSANFADTLITTYGFDELWKLTDIYSGTIIPATVNSAYNGVLTGWDLQQHVVPFPGETGLAPDLNGTTSFRNMLGSGSPTNLNTIWNTSAFTMLVVGKITNASWLSGLGPRNMCYFSSGGNSSAALRKLTTGNFIFRVQLNGVVYNLAAITPAVHGNSPNLFMAVGTFSDVDNRSRIYWNGGNMSEQAGVTNSWVGSLFEAEVGSFASILATDQHQGGMCYFAIKGAEISSTDVANIYAASGL